MGPIKKYKMYKLALQTLLFVNVILICLGVVASVHYFQDHDTTAMELFFVGISVFCFGILLPGILLYRAEKKIQEVRHKIYARLSSLISVWTENYKDYQGETYKNPLFWGNMAILAAEEFGQDVDHPLMNVFLEFAPYIRKEIKKQSKANTHHGDKKSA